MLFQTVSRLNPLSAVGNLEGAHVVGSLVIERVASPAEIVTGAAAVRPQPETAVLAGVAVPTPDSPLGDVLGRAPLVLEPVEVAAGGFELPG